MSEHSLPTEIEERVVRILEGPEAGRGAAFDLLCAEQPEHAARIRRRIRQMDEIRRDILEPAFAENEPRPTRIGPFRVVELLGEGGMGTVYLGEQDQPLQRRAALKVIKLGMDTRRVLARFETERQALSLMDHRGIARVLEAGATEQGRPWFAMELVDGEPITAFCDHHHLSIRERLALFVEACAAVHHAHQKGVIHRDLKPSNILVTMEDGRPQPKVIDFGLARAMDEGADDRTVLTRDEGIIGTPEYMSPEQIERGGHDVDTRTDVYALGAVLYELLAGSTPFLTTQLRSMGYAEMQRHVCEVEPQRPSTRASTTESLTTATAAGFAADPRARAAELRGDLDWITLKALQKDRDRRYQSTRELAADLQRYLMHEPVLARPSSLAYRVRKFVRRNRIQVAAAAAVLATLIVGLVVSTRLWITARAAQARAQSRAEQAESVTAFLVDLFNHASPSQSLRQDLPVRFVLSRGAKQIRDELRDQPATRARLLATLGLAHAGLGSYAAAESFLMEALDLTVDSEEVTEADSLSWRTRLTEVLVARGEYTRAEENIAAVLDTASQHANSDPALLAEATRVRGVAHWQSGNLDTARELLADAVAGARRAHPGDSLDLAISLDYLGGVTFDSGDHARAQGLATDALEMMERLYPQGHPQSVRIRAKLMRFLLDLGQFVPAEQCIAKARADAERVFGPQHPEVADVLLNQAHLLTKLGRSAEAEPLLRQALEIDEALLRPDHPFVAWLLNDIGTNLGQLSKRSEAREVLERAHGIFEKAFAGDHIHLAICKGNLAEALAAVGELPRAEALAREGLAMLRRLGAAVESEVVAMTSYAWVLISTNRIEDASSLLEEALASVARIPDGFEKRLLEGDVLRYLCHARNRLGDGAAAERHGLRALELRRACGLVEHPHTALLLYNIGWACSLSGNAAQTEAFLRDSIELYRKVEDGKHPDLVWPLSHLATMLAADHPADALPLLEEAVAIRRATLPPSHPWLVNTVLALARVHERLARYDTAEPLYLEVHAAMLEVFGPEHESTQKVRAEVAKLYEQWGKPDRAAEWAGRRSPAPTP